MNPLKFWKRILWDTLTFNFDFGIGEAAMAAEVAADAAAATEAGAGAAELGTDVALTSAELGTEGAGVTETAALAPEMGEAGITGLTGEAGATTPEAGITSLTGQAGTTMPEAASEPEAAGIQTLGSAQPEEVGTQLAPEFEDESEEVGEQKLTEPTTAQQPPSTTPSTTYNPSGAEQNALSQGSEPGQSQFEAAQKAASKGPSFFDNPIEWAKANPVQAGLGALGIGTLGYGMMHPSPYGIPAQQQYSGSLSKFHYDPSTYTPTYATPNVYTPRYAEGGIASLAQGGNAPTMMGQDNGHLDFMSNSAYPMSQQDTLAFNTPTQMPAGAQQVASQYEVATNPLTGEPTAKFARGGITELNVGGKLLKGRGDGMSDSIPANIGGKQQARLADGEFVVPADVVSHLGNGSTDAGAKHLYAMMDRVRKARTGRKSQGKQIKSDRYMPA